MTSNFNPGREIHRFKTKTGKDAIIRYPHWSDLHAFTEYINTLSKENTYITVFNQEITYEDEVKYLSKCFKKIELKEAVQLVCLVEDELVAISGLNRANYHRERDNHVAEFAISVRNEYRDSGIGFMLSRSVIEEGLSNIPGIKIICLNVYAGNDRAIHLYEKLGFEESGRIPGGILYRGNYIDDIKMYLNADKFKTTSID